jgi:hypothetical protein
VRRFVSSASRAGLAGVLFLLVLAVLRWGPVSAASPLDVRALPLAVPALVLAVVAALTGAERRPRPVAPLAWAAAGTALALALVILWRGPGGLTAEAVNPAGERVQLASGPIDLRGDALVAAPRSRKWTVEWDGELRAPASGAYRLWLDAAGRVSVSVDGHEVLVAEGDAVRAGRDWPMGRGAHRLHVRLEHAGPGPRLRLGWTRPGAHGEAGSWSETIPPRFLGPEPSVLWWLTDALALLLAVLGAALALAVPWDRPLPPPAPKDVTRGEIGASLLGHAVLVMAMSWPLITNLAGSGPLDRPDGRLNTWILAWDVHALTHAPSRLFQAPIFHPLPDALTFTENLILPALLAAPAILLGTPILGYNLVLLGSAIVSGLGAQLLIRRASGDRLAAFVGGAAFAVGAHRWFRLSHLHAEVTLFLPFVLLAFDRFWERPTLRRGLLVGLLLALQGLSSIYLGAIAAVALAVAIGAAVAAGLGLRSLTRLTAGLLLGAALLAPVAWPYLRMRAFQGVEFTLADQANYATNLLSYAASSTRLYGPISGRHLDTDAARDALFPGLALLLLGIAGLARAPRRFRFVACAASLVAIVISLGPETAVYRFLYEHVVLFHGIRALSRFSLIPVLALSVLAGFALAGRWRAALLALPLLLVESCHAPLRLAPYHPPSEAARWLAGQDGAVASLPLGPEQDTDVMLQATAHFRPLLNGDSGFIPRPYDRTLELLEGSTSADGLRYLRAVGVRHVVTRDDRPLPLLARFGDERIWGVPDGDAAHVVAAGSGDTAVAVLWTRQGAQLDLGAAQDVGRILFELSDAPWIPHPRVRVSADGAAWETLAAEASLADATLSLTRDPRHALGALQLPARAVRYIQLDPRLPARAGVVWVGSR